MAYVLIGDSTTDLGYRFMEEHDIPFIRFNYFSGGEEFEDDMWEKTDPGAFYDRMRNDKEVPTTAQVNEASYELCFRPFLEKGLDIVFIGLSSGLTGSCDSARAAAKRLTDAHPERKIAIIDSKCASMGEGLLLYYALQKRNEGLPFQELVHFIEATIPNLCHWFTVDDLNHLYRGGRVSKTAAFVGSVLNVKPILNVDDAGKLIPREKVRGRKKSIQALAEKTKKWIVRPEEQVIFISHGDAKEDAEELAAEIRKSLPVRDVRIAPIGPVIGAHSGPGTIAIFFLGEGRQI